jgi:hypothetical protein
MKRKMPKIIEDVGFNFGWSEPKVWGLNVKVEKMPISRLSWHFDIPFWALPNSYYDLKPIDVINNPHGYPKEYKRIMDSDTKYPLDIMYWKKRWLLLDGLHRLAKAKVLGMRFVNVRKIPKLAIPLIQK